MAVYGANWLSPLLAVYGANWLSPLRTVVCRFQWPSHDLRGGFRPLAFKRVPRILLNANVYEVAMPLYS